MNDGKRIAPVDFNEATYVGSEDDGVYYQVAAGPGGYYVSAVVDCNSASFTDSLVKDDGPYDTEAEAEQAGLGAAIEWCLTNGVGYEQTV